jgi:hypothetical protein
LEEEQIGRPVFADGANHGSIRGVGDFAGVGIQAALELIGLRALRAEEIYGRGVGLGSAEGVRGAGGAVEFAGAPILGEDAGDLGA